MSHLEEIREKELTVADRSGVGMLRHIKGDDVWGPRGVGNSSSLAGPKGRNIPKSAYNDSN